ncbi:hypothetical protein DFH11DRAFT_1734646 [Phellopilus nigrolimitatus]|nr:hypothetical protein DFH11DRAFT_1734646 [Phellopilus nigrolimitatus]
MTVPVGIPEPIGVAFAEVSVDTVVSEVAIALPFSRKKADELMCLLSLALSSCCRSRCLCSRVSRGMPLTLALGPTANPTTRARSRERNRRPPACPPARRGSGWAPVDVDYALKCKRKAEARGRNGGGVLWRRRGERKITQEADKALQAAVAGEDPPDARGDRSEIREVASSMAPVAMGTRLRLTFPIVELERDAHAGSVLRREREVRLAHSGFRGIRAVLVAVEALLHGVVDVVAVAAVGNGRADRPTRSLIAAKNVVAVAVERRGDMGRATRGRRGGRRADFDTRGSVLRENGILDLGASLPMSTMSTPALADVYTVYHRVEPMSTMSTTGSTRCLPCLPRL